MRNIICALALMVALTGAVLAQEESSKDLVGIYAGFTNINADGVDNLRGINISGQIKLYGYGPVRLEAVGDFATYSVPGYNLYTYMGGVQAGVRVYHNRLNPFVRIMFGAGGGGGDYVYGTSIGGGVDVNVTKHLFVRVGADRKVFDETGRAAVATTVGVGGRF